MTLEYRSGDSLEVISLPDLVAAKKTQCGNLGLPVLTPTPWGYGFLLHYRNAMV